MDTHSSEDKKEHETKCLYQLQKCPMFTCKTFITGVKMQDHLFITHHTDILEGGGFVVDDVFSYPFSFTYNTRFSLHLIDIPQWGSFWLKVETSRKDKLCFLIQFLKTSYTDSEFHYTVKWHGRDRYVSYSGPVQTSVRKSNDIIRARDCLMLNVQYIEEFHYNKENPYGFDLFVDIRKL